MGLLKQKIEASRLSKILCQDTTKNPIVPNQSPQEENKENINPVPSPATSYSQSNQEFASSDGKEPRKRQRLQGDSITPKIYLEAKNIVTNFGKAIATFALSDLAQPYISFAIQNHINKTNESYSQTSTAVEVSSKDFIEFVKKAKNNINSIEGFRRLILVEAQDTQKEAVLKQVFKDIAETFIKNFSVNWIMHGRVTYKLQHLKFRNKMLRRIQNPESFTYLKGHKEKRNKGRKEN